MFFLLRLKNVASKSVLFIKFVFANLALKTSASKVWSSNIFILIMISKLSVFLTKLLTLGILFLTAVNAVFVAKLLTSGILFSNSVSFIFLTKSVTSGTCFSSSVLPVLYWLTKQMY